MIISKILGARNIGRTNHRQTNREFAFVAESVLAVAILNVFMVSFPSVLMGQGNTAAAQAFQDFYDPLTSELNKNYRNIRFRAAVIESMPIFYSHGVVGEDQYVGESALGAWIAPKYKDLTPELIAKYDPQDQLKIVRAEIARDDFLWTINRSSMGRATDFVDPRRSSYYSVLGSPSAIVAPTWSVALLRPYSKFTSSGDISILDFKDGPLWQGRATKLLEYEVNGFGLKIFRSTFDAKTGICVLETAHWLLPEDDEAPILTRTNEYLYEPFDEGNAHPKLIGVRDKVENKMLLQVLAYDRNYQMTGNEFTGTEYGFEGPPQSITSKVSGVLSATVVFLGTGLVLAIAMVAVLMLILRMKRIRS